MKKYYANNYSDAIKFAWNTEFDFHQSISSEHIGSVECLDIYEGDQVIIKVFWDVSLYNESERYYQVN